VATPSAQRAVPKRDVYRVSHMYTTESRTPPARAGRPRGTPWAGRASRGIEADQAASPGDADTDEEPATPHHHGGRGGALDSSLGNGPTPLMSSGSRPTDNTTEARQKEWRARVARGAERRLDREEAEHERSAQEHVSRYARRASPPPAARPYVEQRVREREPEKRHDGPRGQGVHDRRTRGPAAASGSLAVARAATAISPTSTISPSDSSTHT